MDTSTTGSRLSYIYDIMSGLWSRTDDLNDVRYNHACASYDSNGEKIVITVGGGGAPSSVEAWSSLTELWTLKNALSASRSGPTMVTVNNRVFLMGTLTNVVEYDPDSDQWNDLGTAQTSSEGFLAIPYNL